MIELPTAIKSRRKAPGSKPKSKARTTSTRKGTRGRIAVGKRTSQRLGQDTFIYECTRDGCGYQIVRDEKGEQGQLRFDLKCPKCHNNEFRCLGKGDIPEALNVPVPATPLNFETFKTIGLGSN